MYELSPNRLEKCNYYN
ncbi:hypothetical protein Zm00014a_029634 [Zea mays]|uniref:Uncharacterized protein n=1 Tax=Zea mays TaxID=4577 RepID=A0A3L6GDP8_MAIZE|nr:hypothetical protein Zm00014a_029634 [Zea mays]